MLGLTPQDTNKAIDILEKNPLAYKQLELATSKNLQFAKRIYSKAPRQWELIQQLISRDRMKEAEDLRMELLINLGMVEEARRVEMYFKRIFDIWMPEFSEKIYKNSRLIQS